MDIRRIQQAIDGYKTLLDKQDRARLEFFEQIYRIQAAASAHASNYVIQPSELKRLRHASAPVFSEVPVRVEGEAYAQVLKKLGAIADAYGLGECSPHFFQTSDWKGMLAASPLAQAGSNPAAYLEGFRKLLGSYEMNETQAHIACMLASLGLRTQIEAAAQWVASALHISDVEGAGSLTCPVCGSLPSLAAVADSGTTHGGSKTLWCAQCGTSWYFQRIRCARCGSWNQQHLHLYHLPNDQGHRIASCEECGGYMRTVYTATTTVLLSFEVEDVVMAHLDALAQSPDFASRVL